ncbi:MAG: isocitrate/isopropylmalate dehydrogenase family protein [Acidobacteriota bacterium]|nr:isocitrate/isopropylmalate dehydrogenase family protein [Acidobacteriota bacterium]
MTKVVLIPGDGIGPEITAGVTRVLEKAGAGIEWVEAAGGLGAYEEFGDPLPEETIDKIKEHRIALKGPLTTPVGGGFRSVNVRLRQIFKLYSNIRPAKTIPGLFNKCGDVDLVLFRENTQGLYSGLEQWGDEAQSRAESVAVVTREASEKIVRAAFDYAVHHDRDKVTLVHKANILKLSSGLFLKVGEDVAKDYPKVGFENIIVDNMAMQMVMNPQRFGVVVTTNLFGDILSDLASGLVGGLGLTGSANIGENYAIFEAVHGSAPDIAGQNKANPTALLFSALMLLDYLGKPDLAEHIRGAILAALADENTRTGDVGGKGSTTTFTEAICAHLD